MKLLIKLDICWHILLNQEDLSENIPAAQSLPVLPVLFTRCVQSLPVLPVLFTRCVHIFAQLLPGCIAAITALIGKGESGKHSWEPIQHFPSTLSNYFQLTNSYNCQINSLHWLIKFTRSQSLKNCDYEGTVSLRPRGVEVLFCRKSRYYNIRFYLVTIFRWRGLLKGEFGLDPLSILIFKPQCLSQKRKFPNIAISFFTLFRIGLCRIFILLSNHSICNQLEVKLNLIKLLPESKNSKWTCLLPS